MNPLDIGVIGVIGLSAVFAFARGFVREALSIVAWIGAGFITLYGFNIVFAMVDPMVHNPLLSQLIAGFGLFIASLIVLTILTGIVARTVRSSGLSPIDRTLGFVFGLLRGAFILSLAYLLLETVQPSDRPPWLREAKSVPYLQQGADMIRNTATEQAPWHVVPADNKWFTRMVVSAVVIDALESLNLAYPKVDPVKKKELDAAKKLLLSK